MLSALHRRDRQIGTDFRSMYGCPTRWSARLRSAPDSRATMVTAGVYMIARLGFMFSMAPSTLDLVATVWRIDRAVRLRPSRSSSQTSRRCFAYSTISQLGYMFLGVGSGAYASGIFHVMTHAFFKGLLFPVRRFGNSRARRRAGHEQDGRPANKVADHVSGRC